MFDRFHIRQITGHDNDGISKVYNRVTEVSVNLERRVRIEHVGIDAATAAGTWAKTYRIEQVTNDDIGIYPNMLDAHSPFQIDGNFGYTAGVIEMLMQSYAGFIQLLPALPSIWPEGEIKGIKARGGFLMDIAWENGELKEARIHSTLGGNCRLRYEKPLKVKGAKVLTAKGENSNPYFGVVAAKGTQQFNKIPLTKLPEKEFYTIDFETKKGKTYTISLK